MPYVSPNGTLKSTKKLPISNSSKARGSTKPSQARADSEVPLAHVPSKELGEVSSRDRDARIVRELGHWRGFVARRESENTEGEDEGPLGEKSVSGESAVSVESEGRLDDAGEERKSGGVVVDVREVGVDVPDS